MVGEDLARFGLRRAAVGWEEEVDDEDWESGASSDLVVVSSASAAGLRLAGDGDFLAAAGVVRDGLERKRGLRRSPEAMVSLLNLKLFRSRRPAKVGAGVGCGSSSAVMLPVPER